MPQPLAIVCYERVLPGSQLMNRLRDLQYDVLAVNDAARVIAAAQKQPPLVVFMDLTVRGDACGVIQTLKTSPASAHLPVIAFAPARDAKRLAAAQKAGASLAVSEATLASHLEQILEQSLRVE